MAVLLTVIHVLVLAPHVEALAAERLLAVQFRGGLPATDAEAEEPRIVAAVRIPRLITRILAARLLVAAVAVRRIAASTHGPGESCLVFGATGMAVLLTVIHVLVLAPHVEALAAERLLAVQFRSGLPATDAEAARGGPGAAAACAGGLRILFCPCVCHALLKPAQPRLLRLPRARACEVPYPAATVAAVPQAQQILLERRELAVLQLERRELPAAHIVHAAGLGQHALQRLLLLPLEQAPALALLATQRERLLDARHAATAPHKGVVLPPSVLFAPRAHVVALPHVDALSVGEAQHVHTRPGRHVRRPQHRAERAARAVARVRARTSPRRRHPLAAAAHAPSDRASLRGAAGTRAPAPALAPRPPRRAAPSGRTESG